MGRTLRSKRLRRDLFEAYGGKCAICGSALNEDWHADHIVPWFISKRTNVHEMQPLCRECNQKKGSRIMDLNAYRDGQRGAHDVIIDRVVDQKPWTSIVLPTSYGKSDVIRCCAWDLFCQGLAECSLVVSPNVTLRSQIVHKAKTSPWQKRYRIPGNPLVTELKDTVSAGVRHNANGEFLLSVNIQQIHAHLENYAHFVRSVNTVVFVDETHQYSDQNQWGKVIEALVESGAKAIVLTATPFRSKGEAVIGFEVERYGETDITSHVFRRREGLLYRQHYEGIQAFRECHPHFGVSFRQAWDESVLCRINQHWINLDVSTIVKQDKALLSDLSESQVRRYLQAIARDPSFIAASVKEMCHRLRDLRRALPDAAVIIFTCNDTDANKVNEHGNKIREEIARQDPTLQCVIRTSADDGEPEREYDDFIYRGVGDVLIVKQMASLGLDVSRLKICVDLSSMRKINSYIQRINRCSRIHKGAQICHAIGLKDCLSVSLFNKFVREQGGAVVREMELVDEEVVPEKPRPDEEDGIIIHRAFADGVSDSGNQHLTEEDRKLGLRLSEQLPDTEKTHTISERAEIVRSLREDDHAEVGDPVNTNDELEIMRREINRNIRYRASLGGEKTDQDLVKMLWGKLYKRAKLPKKMRIADVRSIEQMQSLLEVSRRMRHEAKATTGITS